MMLGNITPAQFTESLIRINDYVLEQEINLTAHRTLKVFTTKNPNTKASFIVNSKGGFIKGTHYKWLDQEKLDKYVKENTEYYASREKQAQERKQLTKEKVNDVKVGDIFYATFGYEANFVDYYQIMEKKGSMIKIQACRKHREYDGNMDGNCGYTCYTSAVKDDTHGDIITKRLYGDRFTHGGHYFHKWSGNAVYEYNDH